MAIIEVFSDFLCPFCYIAEAATLDCMQSRYPDLEVVWRGFELHPEIPRGGIPTRQFFSEQHAREFEANVQKVVRQFDLPDITMPEHLPNTMRAHALTEFARTRGVQRQVREAIMDAYWRQGLDIENDQILGDIAHQHGLPREKALAASLAAHFELLVVQNRAAGYERGVVGVPTFFVDGKSVTGCQAICTLEAAMTP